MLVALIGHRGSGKSTWLKRFSNFVKAEFVDLDFEISQAANLSLADIFSKYGEKEFRRLEEESFNKIYARSIISSHPIYVAVGAGFEFLLPEDVYTIWIQRELDSSPKAFLDRPRLNNAVTPSQEYMERYAAREKKYASTCYEKICLPEGFPRDLEEDENLIRRLWLGEPVKVNACITLSPNLLHNLAKFDYFLSRRSNWEGVSYELRTDEFNSDEIVKGLSFLKSSVVSYRSLNFKLSPEELKKYNQNILFDWALELGACPWENINIFSLHELQPNESIQGALSRFSEQQGSILKFSPVINSFSDLLAGHEWQQLDPEHRVFLPRSSDGRWLWYRLLMKYHQKLNFIREGRNFIMDQPSLFEWVGFRNERNRFAAIIGDPVNHSLTPSFQAEFFSKIGVPVLRVQLNEKEWSPAVIKILENLGLRYAAITSPLKPLAGELVLLNHSVNTIYYDESKAKWIGVNTDGAGFSLLVNEALEVPNESKVAVWGGSGVLGAVKEKYPHAGFYHASTGQLKAGSEVNPNVVFWAVGRGHMLKGTWPPNHWSPHIVVDLNYSDDSPGREYALLTNAKYVSGLAMFKEQGMRQRDFWSQCER